jgi:DNA-directed RNA polymerase specialized sigma24 family protein
VEDVVDAVGLSDSVPNPEETYARTEQKAALRGAIAKLRPRLQNVVELHDLREYSLLKLPKHSGSPSRQRRRDCFMREPHYAGQQN